MDQEFKIVITGDASSAQRATQQTTAGLKGLKDETTNLGEETKRTSNVVPELEDRFKKSGAAAEESGISMRELRRILGDIGNVAAPGAGAALGELAYGQVGAILALLTAVAALKKSLDDVAQKENDIEATEFTAHQKAIDDVREAWVKAKLKLAEYFQAVKDAGEEKDPLAAHLARIQAVSAAQSAANIRELEQQQKITIEWMKRQGFSAAQIDAAELKNQITMDAARDAAANRTTANIQEDIDRRKSRQTDIDPIVEAENNRVQRATDALNQANTAKTNATPKPEDVVAQNNQIADLEGTLAKAKDFVKTAQAAVDDPHSEAKTSMGTTIGGAVDRAILRNNTSWRDQVQTRLDEAKADQARQQAALAAANQAIGTATAELAAATAAYQKAANAGVENKAAITREEDEVKTQTAVEAATEAGERAANAAKQVENAVKRTGGKEDDIVEAGAKAADDMKNLRDQGYGPAKITADYNKAQTDRRTPGMFSDEDVAAIKRYTEYNADREAVSALHDLLLTLGNNASMVIEIVRQHAAGATDQAEEIKQLKVTVESLVAQMKASVQQQY